jgi:hypothetical protein
VTYDLSDLEAVLVRENDLLLLGFNGGETYVPLRIMARVEVPYIYDVVAEGQLPAPLAASPSVNGITNNTYLAATQLGSQYISGKPSDIFDLTRYPNYVYQAFFGIAPAALRVFLQQPFKTDQRSLPTIGFTPAYAQSGYFDGLMSPLYRPSRKTQTWVLPGMSIALGYENVEPQAVYPLVFFYLNALNVGVVSDPATAYAMVSQPGVAKIFTVAGIQPVSYNVESHYGIKGIHLDDTLQEIASELVSTGQSPLGLVTRQQ